MASVQGLAVVLEPGKTNQIPGIFFHCALDLREVVRADVVVAVHKADIAPADRVHTGIPSRRNASVLLLDQTDHGMLAGVPAADFAAAVR